MSSQLHSTLIAAAIGTTVALVTVAASMIYDKLQKSKQQQEHRIMQSRIQNLNNVVANLQEEVNELLALQKQLKSKRRSRRRMQHSGTSVVSNDLDSEFETCSTVDTEVGDDEFYDCSDLEDDDTDTLNGYSASQDSSLSTLTYIDQLLDDKNQQIYVYDTLKDLVGSDPNNAEIVWRFAKISYDLADNESDITKKKEILEQGIKVCEKILTSHENVNLYKWYGILIGCQSEILPTKEKIANAYRFKEYVEKALELDPTDSLLHYLLGRFKYEVSELTWFERKVAATLFGEPPAATYEDALKHFQEAEKIAEKPHMENKFFLGKCHISLSQFKEAEECLINLRCLTASSEREKQILEEVDKLLSTCANR